MVPGKTDVWEEIETKNFEHSLPLKMKKTKYPRYFRSEDTQHQDCIIVFPSEGSLGSAYYPKTKRWAVPQWKLSDMSDAPVDIEITAQCANRFQAIAFGIPQELPPFKADLSL